MFTTTIFTHPQSFAVVAHLSDGYLKISADKTTSTVSAWIEATRGKQ